jgi:hypothetical protein
MGTPAHFFERAGFDPVSALVLEIEAEELGIEFRYVSPTNETPKEFSASDPDDPDLAYRLFSRVVVEYRGVEITAVASTARRAIGMIFNAARK